MSDLDLDACCDNLDRYAAAGDARSCRDIARAAIREVERLRAERETDYKVGHADASMAEGWERVAGELEHEAEVAALHAERDRLRADLAANEGSEDARLAIAEREVERLLAEVERLRIAEGRVSLAQGLAARWAGDKDVLLASAGRELLRATGGV